MEHLFRQTICLYLNSTVDKYGKMDKGEAVKVKARFVDKPIVIREARSSEQDKQNLRSSDARAYIHKKWTAVKVGTMVEYEDVLYLCSKVYMPRDGSGKIRMVKLALDLYNED